ncbi:MAG: proton-conducting transporter membrane subunit [Zavarzinella sp.]
MTDSVVFQSDNLSWVMAGLILVVSISVSAFSGRYLAGDRLQRRHRGLVALLTCTMIVLVFSNHLLLFWCAWLISNLLLVLLMIHNSRWVAARNSGLLAFKTLGIGTIALGAGLYLLYVHTGSITIDGVLQSDKLSTTQSGIGLLCIAIAAMAQCAVLPFHRWLLSSLNSPTPVSALMHAGLVNGGGYLIVRFAPIVAEQPWLLQSIFVVGLISAFAGTFWKLIQTDIKRMLACSTVGQMGFMLVQCGMGLFVPAISHLCWHGLFKAYLFLNAGTSVRDQRTATSQASPTLSHVVLGLIAGMVGVFAFCGITNLPIQLADTRCLLILMVLLASSHLAIKTLAQGRTISSVFISILASIMVGICYGFSISLLEQLLPALSAIPAQAMNPVYFAGLGSFTLVWLAMLLDLPGKLQATTAWKRLYMMALNTSQPHPQTITAIRSAYQI